MSSGAATIESSSLQTSLCKVVGLRKRYGGVRALAGVDLEVHPGRVHAICGENGAGKSTLMKILAGAERPDEGEVHLRGKPVQLRNVGDALENGVAIVFQELSLYPDLDVLTNMFMLHEPSRLGLVSRREMERRARPVLEQVGLDVSLTVPVGQLKLSERQLIEIARALLAESDVLILDEPNSALNATESERLFAVVRQLRDRGVSVLYISHRLEEVFRISDVITVMRNGLVITTQPASELSIPEVVALMIGRDPSETARQRSVQHQPGSPLRLEGVSVDGALSRVDLTANPGEIVGLAGLEGSGVRTIFDVIFGVTGAREGRVTLPSGKPGPRTVPAAVRAGIAFIPGDRRNQGVMLDQSVLANLSHVYAGVLGRSGFFLRRSQLRIRAQGYVERLRIVTGSLTTPVHHLSGGNQQKVVLGKWLQADPEVLIFDDPTRGVDVGAKVEIYSLIGELADRGRVVLFTTSELPEFITLCDRVVVLYNGEVRGELAGEALVEHRLLEAINTGVVAGGSSTPQER